VDYTVANVADKSFINPNGHRKMDDLHQQ